MKISDPIKQATDILVSQRDVFVDIEVKNNRFKASEKGILLAEKI